MNAVVVRNSRQGLTPPPPPRRGDGELYTYAMFFGGDERIAYADTLEDLLDALVPGYAQMAPEERPAARIRLAVAAQVATQAYLNADVAPEVWAQLTEDERAVLLGSRHEQPRIDFWDPEVTLVLVETGYAPYTDVDQPISGIADVRNPPNLLWLRPADEYGFLESLHDAGFIRLHRATVP